jgi:hypothetical protein
LQADWLSRWPGLDAAQPAGLRIDGRGPDELVFTTPAGYPLRMSNFRRHVWNPAVSAAGLVDSPRTD